MTRIQIDSPPPRPEPWLGAIRRGDRDAFDAMTRAVYQDLFDFALGYLRDAAAAEDVVQDVLLAVWANRRDWRPRSSAHAYLFGAVRNRALNYLRDTRNRPRSPVAEHELPAASEDPEHNAQAEDLDRAFQAALQLLPERRQLVYRLSRLYGLTYEEIAAALDISVNTVRTQMAEALMHFRKHLAEFLR